MSFSFGFFNAKNMDRTYTAEDFSQGIFQALSAMVYLTPTVTAFL